MTCSVGVEIDLLCWWSKWTWFQCGGSELPWLQCRDHNWHGFVWGRKMTWFKNLNWFWWGSKTACFRVLVTINVVFVSGGIQNWLVFRVPIEINLVLHGGSNWVGFSARTEVDLFFVRGSKLTFLCAGRKLLAFSASTEIDFGVCDGGRNGLDLSVGDRTWLDFSVGVKLIWLLYGW